VVNAGPAPTSAQVELARAWLSVPAAPAAFALELPGATIGEFPINLNDKVRQLPAGVAAEDRAIVITHDTQTIEIGTLVFVNEALPALTITLIALR